MKKRFVTTLIALIACVACVLGLAACGDGNADSVAGKKYNFEKAEITQGATGAEKELAEEMLNEMYEDGYLEFGQNGEFKMVMMGTAVNGTYTQSGATVTATLYGEDQNFKVSGNSITMSGSEEGLSFKLTYRLDKSSVGEISGGDNENEDEGDASVITVAGKTFNFSDLSVSFNSSVNQEVKDELNNSLAALKAGYADSTVAFDSNGGFTMSVMGNTATGTYTQNSAALVMTVNGEAQNATLSNNQLTLSITNQGVTMNLIYTLAENA